MPSSYLGKPGNRRHLARYIIFDEQTKVPKIDKKFIV